MNKESFVLYESAYKQFKTIKDRLGKDAACDLIDDIMQFGLYGVIPPEESNSYLYGFEQIITSIANAKDRYQTAVENGKRGGRKPIIDRQKVLELKATGLTNKEVAAQVGCSVSSVEKIISENREKTVKTVKTHNNLNDNVNDNENEKGNGLWAAPTTEEPPAHTTNEQEPRVIGFLNF